MPYSAGLASGGAAVFSAAPFFPTIPTTMIEPSYSASSYHNIGVSPAPLQRRVEGWRIVVDRIDVVHGLIPVMAGRPAIHVLAARSVKDVDARDKPGHDRVVLMKTLDQRQYADPGGDNSAQAHGQAERLGIDGHAKTADLRP